MAQWQELLRLDSALQSRVSQLYECRFPREVRHWLCTAIESQDWDSAAVDRNKAMACFRELLVYLEEQWNRSVQEKNILQGPDLPGMRDYLLKHFEAEPISLAIILSECLKEEKKILASVFEAQGCVSPAVDQKWRQLDNKVNELKHRTLETKKEIKSLEVLNEKLDFIQDSWQFQEQHNGQSRAAVEKECCKQASFITETNQIVLQQIENILKLAEEIVVTLTDVELPEWKCRQQMACIGAPADTCLDNLQKWFTAVAEVLLRVREQLHKLQEQSKQYNSIDVSNLSGPMAENEKSAVSLLTKLLANALVVEKQPIMSSLPQRPLILKTKVQFTVTVRFLANLPEFKCPIKAKPVFDKDVEEAKTVKGFRGFDFSRADCKVLDVDTPGGGLVAEFGHMSIKDKRHPKSKGTSEPFSRLGVTEELHIIKFVADFQHAGLRCNIEASSLPLVVVSSTNQIPSAWASVMWYNMLCTSEPRNLSLFANPPPLTWKQLSQVLSWQFLSVGQRELDEHQLSMLREKFVDNPDDPIHWNKFSKNESAWIWIDGILDLIKKHLVDLWREGFIMGFVNRKRTRALLQEKKTGTFLLRFSESNNDGAITFSWVEHSNGETHVHAVDPCTKQELSVMSLPDIINHYSLRAKKNMTMNPLLYLYPDIDKDVAFGPYYKSSGKVKDGYVVRRLMPVTLMSVSFLPSPPPSPPREIPPMDMDMNMETDMDINPDQLIQDLFTELTYLQNATISEQMD
ncbi:signal transducer and activator of transcription 1-alpha/beta isoform X2 [Larimichthys crocea]|uniref:signal transducer and activator of transcription 1-alpha/beta isoform X2 n=1 Tax=Larimichthys crocea TaxID=215358 RepID=UPI000F5D928B|nr:signal transducer and activator of transcription 1-alpha/beta isoform X2 [Larimichthys crocea]